jgi:ribosomal-protein-alanine N-acetyltransferase
MEFYPSLYSREDCEARIKRYRAHFEAHGFGLWAVELPGEAPFIGLIGLEHPNFEAHFTPCVEVGWRLGAPYWGRGYATEGAIHSLRFAFEHLGLDEIVSMTARINMRSRRVMEKLGMTHDEADDFDHPRVPAGSRLCRHVLYRIRRPPVCPPNHRA